MGYIVYVKDAGEKSKVFNLLHRWGLNSKPSPFPSHAEICRYVVIFRDHFYTAHGQDLNAIMDGEEMFELRNLMELNQIKDIYDIR